MATVPIDVAATQLPQLFARVRAGEDVVIESGEDGGMRLVPTPFRRRIRRQLGTLAGRIKEAPGVWDPLTDDELKDWGL